MKNMKKSWIIICLCSNMLTATMPLNASTAWTTTENTSTETNAISEKNRGIVARMELPEFNSIYCDVVANISIEQGNEYLIEARGPEMIVHIIQPEVRNKVLYIETTNEYKIKKNEGIHIRVVLPDIEQISNDGVGNITFKGTTEVDVIKVKNDGVGNITFNDLQCRTIIVDNDGVGNITLKGKSTGWATFGSDGVGSIYADDFEATNITAKLDGVGGIHCYATESITCVSNGIGNIYYKGDPKKAEIRQNGIGKVRRK